MVEPKDQTKSFYELGQIFARMSNPWTDVPRVVCIGLKHDTADEAEEELYTEVFFQDTRYISLSIVCTYINFILAI